MESSWRPTNTWRSKTSKFRKQNPNRKLAACPQGDELPPPVPVPFTKTQLEVLKRDEYRCQYPGCSVMCGLHPHHIVFRSHTGKKSRAESDSPSNVLTLCFVHHRMLHAGNIGLKRKAPDELEWRRPELMESTVERFNELAVEAFEPDDFEHPEQEMANLDVDPIWDNARSDPRFQDLVRRMNFPE